MLHNDYLQERDEVERIERVRVRILEHITYPVLFNCLVTGYLSIIDDAERWERADLNGELRFRKLEKSIEPQGYILERVGSQSSTSLRELACHRRQVHLLAIQKTVRWIVYARQY